MKIKHHEIKPNPENPFADCKLDREQYAKVLTDIVSTYADGFVLAINNDWGAGKTTFIKMWQQYLHLEKNGFKTVYFNAWENDFNNNPLIPFMAEFNSLIQSDDDQLFKSVLQKGTVLIKNALPAVAKAIAKRYIDTDEMIDGIENTAKAAVDILEDEIKEYANKKKAITEFRDELRKFVEFTSDGKPLVFFIDELDRCRPNYAVEVLEQIKHFFAVPGIVFVLSIDKNHLASAICGVYGSEQINTDEYLRRFIDLEYSIPKPSAKKYCEYLYEYYSFDDLFLNSTNGNSCVSEIDKKRILTIIELLSVKSNATLRQLEKIFGLTRLILNSVKLNKSDFAELLFILVFIKIKEVKLFEKIENNEFSLQQLSDAFFALIPYDRSSQNDINLVYFEALLLRLYNNNPENLKRMDLHENVGPGIYKTTVHSQFGERDSENTLSQNLDSIRMDRTLNTTRLSSLINKINLMEPLNI